MKCSNCGNEILENQKFCTKCGRSANEPSIDEKIAKLNSDGGIEIGLLIKIGIIIAIIGLMCWLLGIGG